MAKRIAPVGKSANLPLDLAPASGWWKASDWQNWKSKLPNSYAYRARAVDASGNPLTIERMKGSDMRGLIYIGETGVKYNDSSTRLMNLAKGLTKPAKTYQHSAAKCFWSDGWDKKLQKIDQTYVIEVAWDEQIEETVLAGKHSALPGSQSKDQTITNSSKGLAMKVEREMLRQYESEHGERPPINKAKAPGLRDTDRKTKRTTKQDTRNIGP